jgi:hypothetical protein
MSGGVVATSPPPCSRRGVESSHDSLPGVRGAARAVAVSSARRGAAKGAAAKRAGEKGAAKGAAATGNGIGTVTLLPLVDDMCCHVGPHLQQAQARSATSSRSATSARSATSSRSATFDGPHLQQAQASPRRVQGGRTGRTHVREGFSDQGLIWKAKISI